jgi:YcxB-like protein
LARIVFDPAMSENVPPAAFILRYVPDIQDLSECMGGRLRASRRQSFRTLMTALGFMVIPIALLTADPSSPKALLLLVIGTFFASAFDSAVLLMKSSPRRFAARARSQHLELSEAYEVTVSITGITSRIRHLTTIFEWPYFTAVEETKRLSLLTGRDGAIAFALPKHGLTDAAQVDPLRDFLHARRSQSPKPPELLEP